MRAVNRWTILRPWTRLVATTAILSSVWLAGPRAHAVESVDDAGLDSEVHCSTCHGKDGISRNARVPSLAGQPTEFIVEQLRQFQTGERASPCREKLPPELTAAQARALADHYSALPPPSQDAAFNPALMAKGQALAENRVCGSCHRSRFQGGGRVPRLAGQREEYLRASLIAYREHRRVGQEGRMTTVAELMPDDHILALAHYLNHLP